MIIIVDGGSTKVEWQIIDRSNDVDMKIYTTGFNPYYHDRSLFEKSAREVAQKINPSTPEAVYYYGTGCSSDATKAIIADVLGQVFPHGSFYVEHDLIASARALFKNKPGLACILGTGSNSCLYDGNDIIENVPSIGWMIGDEGSGTYLGKMLITDYMRFQMPDEIRYSFEKGNDLNFEKVLNIMYSQQDPNNFFAKFPKYIGQHLDEEYYRNLVLKNFEDFYTYQISKYTDFGNYELGFVGSIAYHFSDILRLWGQNNGLKIGKIYKAPMEGLVEYHDTIKVL